MIPYYVTQLPVLHAFLGQGNSAAECRSLCYGPFRPLRFWCLCKVAILGPGLGFGVTGQGLGLRYYLHCKGL